MQHLYRRLQHSRTDCSRWRVTPFSWYIPPTYIRNVPTQQSSLAHLVDRLGWAHDRRDPFVEVVALGPGAVGESFFGANIFPVVSSHAKIKANKHDASARSRVATDKPHSASSRATQAKRCCSALFLPVRTHEHHAMAKGATEEEATTRPLFEVVSLLQTPSPLPVSPHLQLLGGSRVISASSFWIL